MYKCLLLSEAHSKLQREADTYKADYATVREKLVTAEVQVKSLETEKHLIKEGEKRLMQVLIYQGVIKIDMGSKSLF